MYCSPFLSSVYSSIKLKNCNFLFAFIFVLLLLFFANVRFKNCICEKKNFNCENCLGIRELKKKKWNGNVVRQQLKKKCGKMSKRIHFDHTLFLIFSFSSIINNPLDKFVSQELRNCKYLVLCYFV